MRVDGGGGEGIHIWMSMRFDKVNLSWVILYYRQRMGISQVHVSLSATQVCDIHCTCTAQCVVMVLHVDAFKN